MIDRTRTQSVKKVIKQFRLHSSNTSTNRQPRETCYTLFSLTINKNHDQCVNIRRSNSIKHTKQKYFTQSKVQNKTIELRKSISTIQNRNSNNLSYTGFARPSSYKHKKSKIIKMHKTFGSDELYSKERRIEAKPPPKNFLLTNSLFTRISLNKKIKDFVQKRKQYYYDDVIQNIFG